MKTILESLIMARKRRNTKKMKAKMRRTRATILPKTILRLVDPCSISKK
jgi:hypothetical protein